MNRSLPAYTSNQVMRITRVTKRKLDYWIERGLVRPDIERAKGRGKVRLFSFQSLLEVRVVEWLRHSNIPLQLIRKVVRRLRERGVLSPLSRVRFAVVETAGNRPERPLKRPRQDIVFQSADGAWESGQRPGQILFEMTIPLKEFRRELEHAVEEDRRIGRVLGRIEKRRGVMGSTPVIAGTRIPTKAIWNLSKDGYDVDHIVATYPGLTRADVKAALREEGKRRRVKSA